MTAAPPPRLQRATAVLEGCCQFSWAVQRAMRFCSTVIHALLVLLQYLQISWSRASSLVMSASVQLPSCLSRCMSMVVQRPPGGGCLLACSVSNGLVWCSEQAAARTMPGPWLPCLPESLEASPAVRTSEALKAPQGRGSGISGCRHMAGSQATCVSLPALTSLQEARPRLHRVPSLVHEARPAVGAAWIGDAFGPPTGEGERSGAGCWCCCWTAVSMRLSGVTM